MTEIAEVVSAVMGVVCAVVLGAIYLRIRAYTPRRGSAPPPRMKAPLGYQVPAPASSRPRAVE